MATPRRRLDETVVERGLTETRSHARALILAGDVLVNGIVTTRAGAAIGALDRIELEARPRFASRGGEKLAHALAAFGIDARGRVCADLGASTGGFTDCLLQAGASRVYAVDVGYGQLVEKLRRDSRVVVLDRTNARLLRELPEPVALVTIDVSFISLRLILPVAARLLAAAGICVPLIKPQFEAGRGNVGKNGVVRDGAVHRQVLNDVLGSSVENGFAVLGLTRSPLVGPAGNIEFLAHLQRDAESLRLEPMIDALFAEETK